VVGRQLGLQRQHAVGLPPGILTLRTHACETEDRLHVLAEGDAGLVEVVEAVVALVRQRQTGLHEERDVALGVPGSGSM
jgi:hypothetical protein